jgi:hypothetical protein
MECGTYTQTSMPRDFSLNIVSVILIGVRDERLS